MKTTVTLRPPAIIIALVFWLAAFALLRSLGLAPWQALAVLVALAVVEAVWGVRATREERE